MFQLALIKKLILNSHWCWKKDEADVVELIRKIPEHLPCIASIEHSWSGQVLVSGFVGCSTISIRQADNFEIFTRPAISIVST